MFQLDLAPADPILGLTETFKADTHPDKINLGVGVYQDATGQTPILEAVKQAERRLLETETSKSYLSIPGVPEVASHTQELLFGEGHAIIREGRAKTAQTPGGTGALRVAADFLQRARPQATVWLSNPSWANHRTIFEAAGFPVKDYRYYDRASQGLNGEGFMADLEGVADGDVLILHGCCHNPCGADLTLEQWSILADMALEQGFTVLIDLAYQGMGSGLVEDVQGLRLMASRLGELIVAASCSKNLGLYRERTGVALFFGRDTQSAAATQSHGLGAARRVYSMPPAHGALLAGRVLSDPELRSSWERELEHVCGRMISLRRQLSEKLSAKTDQDFSFIAGEKGMFSFLGLSVEQAKGLRQTHGLYMLDSSRINVAALNADNMDKVVAAVASAL
ncbi:MAG TPA: aromatic amino acid aminotransferase [Gammaproteobacteria bacterium]|nr:aromatic amino acid aminotransferase [Gammaproteobacteria bacterium]